MIHFMEPNAPGTKCGKETSLASYKMDYVDCNVCRRGKYFWPKILGFSLTSGVTVGFLVYHLIKDLSF